MVSSWSEDIQPPARQRFTPLLEQTLDSLRAGRWWLNRDQRRVYDRELRRWLAEADPARPAIGTDDRLKAIDRVAPLVRAAFDEIQRRPPRANRRGGPTARILVWTRPGPASPLERRSGSTGTR